MKKFIAIFILAVMVLSTLAGCSSSPQNPSADNTIANTQSATPVRNTVPVTQPITANQQIDAEQNTPTQGNAETANNYDLPDLPFTENINARGWHYNDVDYKVSLCVNAGWCVDTDVVNYVAYITDIKKDHAEYAEHLSEDKSIQSTLLAMNDPSVNVTLEEYEDGYRFGVYFYDLEKADRASRIAAAEEFIGITADSTTTAFYLTALEAELKGYGFT